MKILCGLLLGILPAFADSLVVGGSLLDQADANQLAAWLGEGDLVFVNRFSGTPGVGASVSWHAAVNDIGRTFTLIETNRGLIGGYNPQSWDSLVHYHLTPDLSDRTAFLFNLSTTAMFGQRTGPLGAVQTYNGVLFGPVFGLTDLEVTPLLAAGTARAQSYGGLRNVFGNLGTTGFVVYSVETYTIPEPSAVLLLSAVVFTAGFVRRRRQRSE